MAWFWVSAVEKASTGSRESTCKVASAVYFSGGKKNQAATAAIVATTRPRPTAR